MGAIFELREKKKIKKNELYGMYKNIYHYVFQLYENKQTASQMEQTAKMGFAQNDIKIKSVKVTSFANSPPNQMSHCR